MLTVTEMLRKKGVVDKFVEFFGDGLSNLPLADRATIANMSPEFGSTCAIFPIDQETLRYLELSGRPQENTSNWSATYAKRKGLWRADGQPAGAIHRRPEPGSWHGRAEPGRSAAPAGSRAVAQLPRRLISRAARKMAEERAQKNPAAQGIAPVTMDGQTFELRDGAVLIAAITSCTNTSNPVVMVGAGLLARNARQRA